MPLPLTPHVLETAYTYLRATQPFKGWHLPDADEVEFGVTRHRDRYADHTTYYHAKGGGHVIRVSASSVKTTEALMQCLAHEMIHARIAILKTPARSDHGAVFKRLASRVCRVHGWELEKFL